MIKFTATALITFGLFSPSCNSCYSNPSAPSGLYSSGPDIWIHPNSGSSDYLKMFSNPELWPEARKTISTFQFHQGNLRPNCPNCEGNTYDKFIEAKAFQWLNMEGKLISFEAGALKYHGGNCAQSVNYLISDSLEAISNVRAGGGSVAYISMDEPFIAGMECGFTEDKTAGLVRDFIRAMPVRVGLTEAYPTFGPEEMKKNIEALERAGIKLPYVHFDVDRYAAQRPGNNSSNREGYNVAEDMREMRRFLRGKGIPMGIIIWGEDGTSNQTFSADAIMMSRQMLSALGSDVDRLIFESWSDYLPDRNSPLEYAERRLFPLNLPETEPGTLTYLLNQESQRYKR